MPKGGIDNFFESLLGDSAQNRMEQEKRHKGEEEESLLIRLMGEYEGNISMVARKMQISRNTLYKKLKKYNIRH